MRFLFISFFVCLLSAAVLKKLLPKNALSTVKEKPMLLGLSVYFSVLATTALVLNSYGLFSLFITKLLVGSLLILTLGIVDDIWKLSIGLKLLGQLIIASFIVFLGVRTTIYYLPVWANILLSVIWIVALLNAFNLLDIKDGLCTGISFIISIFFLLVSMATNAEVTTVFFWIMCGATLATLVYNFPPAKLYLGDSGSMLLGFIFACCALDMSYAPNFRQEFALFTPLLLLGLPLCDMSFAMAMRWKRGIPIVHKSNDHLVLMMKDRGFGNKRILVVMYAICIAFGICALLLQILAPLLKIWLLGAILLCLLLVAVFIGSAEPKKLQSKSR
ncbi:MAG: undecaprenyl/decaprenyl-phosphate alpha-N-acetylglucosaminyl 1-phosphate transferase [Candidatus Omnitrophica bacterium]|nr:undecaprenyl/decaprenyl-phosphate alpha-N-acetylglucosaminyl 1-phosphate transferase [Candidatus Omnitrophota bacterium]